MKRKNIIFIIIITCLSFLFIVSTDCLATNYTLYINHRFGFGADRPASFTATPPPDNNDGREFISKDKKAHIIISGCHNFQKESETEKDYLQSIANINFVGDVKFNQKGKNYYVISWVEDSYIHYQKTLWGKTLVTFYARYPISQRKEYDPIITHIEKTFRLNYVKGYDFTEEEEENSSSSGTSMNNNNNNGINEVSFEEVKENVDTKPTFSFNGLEDLPTYQNDTSPMLSIEPQKAPFSIKLKNILNVHHTLYITIIVGLFLVIIGKIRKKS